MEYKKQLYVSQTLAFGFRVDFSEVRDPIEELGDKPGALATEFAAMRSDVDDAELPGLWEEVTGSIVEGYLTDNVESSVSGDLNPKGEVQNQTLEGIHLIYKVEIGKMETLNKIWILRNLSHLMI